MDFIDYNFTIDLTNKDIIGVDEVGVGDYFGPMCAAAVYIPYTNYEAVKNLGVQDSKKLSDLKIKKIATALKSSGLIKYAYYQLSPSGYNKLNKSYNANVLKMFIHLKVINEIRKNMNHCDFIFIDQYSVKNSIKKYYDELVIRNNWAKFEPIQEDVLLAYKGEEYSLCVAAASIIARDFFLTKIQDLNNKYSTTFPLGAGSTTKKFAKEFFKQVNYDEKIMNDVCKMSFKMDILEDLECTKNIKLF
ncbi:ribonuclease HIII [Mycoplasmopsis primatum]|uniref:ribonuclease HIII n=1 Tax=Mycoplasmopsis primatum TaxID=55604 RepID=UPI00068E7BB3|nr:ribonuclease HIII [Mycoplasmopsis primatum]